VTAPVEELLRIAAHAPVTEQRAAQVLVSEQHTAQMLVPEHRAALRIVEECVTSTCSAAESAVPFTQQTTTEP
jgi:hypothetical protein